MLRRLMRSSNPEAENPLKQKLVKARRRLNQANKRIERLEAQLWQTRAAGDDVASAFHIAYYGSAAAGGTHRDTYWMGVPARKLPLDLWIYQEILNETRPDLIVETGTNYGGSALYMASMCDLLGTGRVLTVDIKAEGPSGTRPEHPRIRYLTGSSTDPEVVDEVKREAEGAERVMVVLDSDHSEAHVSAELAVYASLVNFGGYLIIEDTNVNGHPVSPDYGPGPMEAVESFLARDSRFEIDQSREKFHLTFNPKGYLKRVR